MVRREQKGEERSWLDQFRACCQDVPPLDPEEGEHPDFVFHSSPPVGLEVTEAFRPNESNSVPRQSQEELWWRIVASAQAIYSELNAPPVTVLAHANPRRLISKADVLTAAETLVQVVRQHLPARGGSVTLKRLGLSPIPLPKPFHTVTVFWFDQTETSHWSVPDGAFQGFLESDFIATLIHRKEKLVPTYRRKAPFIWLLIVADGTSMSRTVQLSDTALSNTYATAFDRVYFFDRLSKRFWRFNTDGPAVAG